MLEATKVYYHEYYWLTINSQQVWKNNLIPIKFKLLFAGLLALHASDAAHRSLS